MDILQAIDINQFPYRYRTILDIPYRYSSPTDIHPIRLYGYPIISHQYIYIYIIYIALFKHYYYFYCYYWISICKTLKGR